MTSDTSASLQFLDPFSGPDDRGPLPPDASFIGAWDLDVGIDTLHEALFLFRSERQDLLWAFTSWSAEATGQYLARRETGDPDWASKTISCGCVAGLPRRGSASDSATRLTRALVAGRVHHVFPRPPWAAGLLSAPELQQIVCEVEDELARNRKAAEDRQRGGEAPIIRLARQLKLSPTPAGTSEHAWLANCPGRGHALMLAPLTNQFGCGYCRQKGGPRELQALYDFALWVRRQRQYDGLVRRLRGSVTIDRRSFIRAAVSTFAFALRHLYRKACTNSSFGGSPADAASAAIR